MDSKKTDEENTGGSAADPVLLAAKNMLQTVVIFCAVLIIAELITVIVLAVKVGENNDTKTVEVARSSAWGTNSTPPTIVINTCADGGGFSSTARDDIPGVHKPVDGVNVCAGSRDAKLDLANVDCITDGLGPQAGANVTKGYQGNMQVDYQPITDAYYKKGMCPVNVHWHLGAEHLSVGQYDESGRGPTEEVDGGIQQGFQCNHYLKNDTRFTRRYNWQHCEFMEVGQTYEVHWPHSAAGACGTPNQYQTPFYDGVLCMDGVLGALTDGVDTALQEQIGVQAQVFTIINDENFYWPDLFRGMIVDGEEMGQDVAKYTGSTTGSGRNNEDQCSPYTPITWQVDRKCHLISASSFDKMCADMKNQRDDMGDDLYPHGARELVSDDLAANNHNGRFLRHS